jgi:transposase-like protein
MAPTKLTETDKEDILTLYRQAEETTANIAERYGVSSTTISRILKQGLPGDEYEELMQQKRGLGSGKVQPERPSPPRKVSLKDLLPAEEALLSAVASADEREDTSLDARPKPQRRQRKRLSLEELSPEDDGLTAQLSLPNLTDLASEPLEIAEAYDPEIKDLQEILQEDILDSGEEFLTDEDEDEDEEIDDEDDLDDNSDEPDEEDDGLDEEFSGIDPLPGMTALNVPTGTMIQVLPLSEALIPRTFYLVVDRGSELITRPLKDFAELGQIPADEVHEKILPIFDNHRVAKRFLRRMQRVVKVPDGRVLPKVSSYLQAKGITRLLIDGQIYSI